MTAPTVGVARRAVSVLFAVRSSLGFHFTLWLASIIAPVGMFALAQLVGVPLVLPAIAVLAAMAVSSVVLARPHAARLVVLAPGLLSAAFVLTATATGAHSWFYAAVMLWVVMLSIATVATGEARTE